MNWEALGAIAAMVGVVTVIVTLFYLAVQVKHATSVARATARQAVTQMNVESLGFGLDSQVLSSASKKATLGEKLTPDEHSNYVRWILARMRVFENAHYQHRLGLLEQDEWAGYAKMIFLHIGPESYAGNHWSWAAPSFSASFVSEIERILNRSGPIQPAPPQVTTENQ